MKRNFVMILIAAVMLLSQSAMAATQTKEEAIRIIESMAMRSSRYVSFKILDSGLAFKNKKEETQIPIDWSKLTSIDESPENVRLRFSTDFTAKIIFPDGKSISDVYNNVFIYIPPSATKDEVAVLVEAVETLRQIAVLETMRTIAGKPTYEETVDFIKSYFASNSEFRMNRKVKDTRIEATYKDKIISVEFRGCNMKSTFKRKEEWFWPDGKRSIEEDNTVNRVVSLDKVESIELWAMGDDVSIYGMYFIEKNRAKDKTWDLPFAVLKGSHEEGLARAKNEKIYKAFNHLRKLCGAPEPLEF